MTLHNKSHFKSTDILSLHIKSSQFISILSHVEDAVLNLLPQIYS